MARQRSVLGRTPLLLAASACCLVALALPAPAAAAAKKPDDVKLDHVLTAGAVLLGIAILVAVWAAIDAAVIRNARRKPGPKVGKK